MALDTALAGKKYDPVTFEVEADRIRQYAEAVHEDNPVHLARKFRTLAGFSDDEITELVDIAAEAYEEAQRAVAAAAAAG